MWVHDEDVGGQLLSDVINKDHENVKYLPGHLIPKNVVAIADIQQVCHDADVLVFALPHQFLIQALEKIKGSVDTDKVKCISLIKGDSNQFHD